MHEKQGFFNLPIKYQNKLQYYMAFLAVFQIMGFITIPPPQLNIVFKVIGIGLNIWLFYFSFSIKSAPNRYFPFITWTFWIVVIFDGLDIYRLLSSQGNISPRNISSLLSLALVIAISPTMKKYRDAINDAKKESKMS